MAHFVPCLKIEDAILIADYFYKCVVGAWVPKTSISNKDKKFLGHFRITL